MDGSSSLGVSDNDDSDSFEWDSDDIVEEAASFNANTDAPGPSSQAGQSASLVQKCREMGFAEEVIQKAIKDNGDNQEDTLFHLLVAYQEERDCHNVDNGFASGCVPQTVDVSDDDDDIWDDMDASGGSTSDASSLDSSTKHTFLASQFEGIKEQFTMVQGSCKFLPLETNSKTPATTSADAENRTTWIRLPPVKWSTSGNNSRSQKEVLGVSKTKYFPSFK